MRAYVAKLAGSPPPTASYNVKAGGVQPQIPQPHITQPLWLNAHCRLRRYCKWSRAISARNEPRCGQMSPRPRRADPRGQHRLARTAGSTVSQAELPGRPHTPSILGPDPAVAFSPRRSQPWQRADLAPPTISRSIPGARRPDWASRPLQ